ncbi:MAG: hypothetical protein M0R46_16435 [Candidatus Muirbacterium halophilum]|nr:hypothetical protein [Candidatus Muirbacterium halophilum]
MKRLKTYKLFIEDNTDQTTIEMATDRMETIKKQISEYNQKKSQIDTIYNTNNDNEIIKNKIESLLGKNDKDRNPFLVEYLHIAKLRKSIDDNQKSIANDKIKKDDLTEELRLSSDQNIKNLLNEKISEINKRISEKTNKTPSINKEIMEAEKSIKDKMKKMEIDIQEYIKKISI